MAEKTEFDAQVGEVKARGEADQEESEQIGFFKTNKARLLADLATV